MKRTNKQKLIQFDSSPIPLYNTMKVLLSQARPRNMLTNCGWTFVPNVVLVTDLYFDTNCEKACVFTHPFEDVRTNKAFIENFGPKYFVQPNGL